MKYAEINKRYTEIVSEYMAAGYILNTATMTGSQGEIASVDLTDGKEILRVLVTRFSDWGDRCSYEGVDIIVGRAGDRDMVKPNDDNDWHTLWSNHLEVLRQERFYQVGESRRGGKFYGTQEEAEAAYEIRMKRYRNKRERKAPLTPTPRMLEVARRVVKERLGVKRVFMDDVKLAKNNDGKYVVGYRSKACTLR